MKLRIISIGRTEDEYIRLGTNRFMKQIRHYNPLEEIRLKEIRGGSGRLVSRTLDQEAEKILGVLDVRDYVVLLDRKGKQMSSEALAEFLNRGFLSPVRSITFVIGGAEGVSDRIRERADELLSLSEMTLPHEFSRLVLLEQIYRAFTILKGKKYHR